MPKSKAPVEQAPPDECEERAESGELLQGGPINETPGGVKFITPEDNTEETSCRASNAGHVEAADEQDLGIPLDVEEF